MSAEALFLSGDAVLLALAVAGAFAGRGRSPPLVYGGALAISAAMLVLAVIELLGGTTGGELVLPLGLPWIGARFRVDALSAFFLVVVNLGAALASLYGLGYGRSEPAPERVLPFFPAFLAGMNLVLDRRRRLHVSPVLGVHVALLLGAGDGASSRGRQRARRLRLPLDGELRHCSRCCSHSPCWRAPPAASPSTPCGRPARRRAPPASL